MKVCTSLIAVALLAVGTSSAARAALDGRDLDGNLATSEAYYDTDRGITWLADAMLLAGLGLVGFAVQRRAASSF